MAIIHNKKKSRWQNAKWGESRNENKKKYTQNSSTKIIIWEMDLNTYHLRIYHVFVTHDSVLLLSQSLLWSLSLATHIVYCTKRRKSHVKSIASDCDFEQLCVLEWHILHFAFTHSDYVAVRKWRHAIRAVHVRVYSTRIKCICVMVFWDQQDIELHFCHYVWIRQSYADNHTQPTTLHTLPQYSYLIEYETGQHHIECDFVRSS